MSRTTFGRYRVLERLGRGGMGEVYVAEDPALGRRVALKVLPADSQGGADRRGRLLDEARAASGLNHPNIITVFDVGESDGQPFIAMELVQGEALSRWARGRERTPREIVAMVRQAAAGLAAAHAAGIVHRDLKPDNLMVRTDGLLKVLDFGLAHRLVAAPDDRTRTLNGPISGTVPYMAPEQVLGRLTGTSGDVFSLGTILYELLTGRHPFAAASEAETMHAILHDVPGPPSRVNPALGAEYDFVLSKALAKDPARRHAGARDLDVDLETLESLGGPAAPAAGAAPAAAAGLRAIAVLPFRNIGGDPDLHFLSVGLADAVITRLSASPDLVVRATGAVSRFQDQAVDPRIVALELQADWVLDASYQRAGDRLRATLRLIESASGRSVWADRMDLHFDDLFDVQDQVAKGISEALTARLAPASSGAGSRPAAARFVPSPAAYQHFMRGVEHWRRATEEGSLAAIGEFEAAVRLEPAYTEAWAQLGIAYHGLVDGGFRQEPEWYEKAAAALERALALDPGDGLVRFLAAAQHLVHGRKREAYANLIAARGRTPHRWEIYQYAGYLFRLCDMLEESMLAFQRSIELEPNLPWSYGAALRSLTILGRFDEAQEWVDRRASATGAPRFSPVLMFYQGRYAELAEVVHQAETAEPMQGGGPIQHAYVVLGLVLHGDRARAAELARRWEGMASVDMDDAALVAAYYGHLGQPDRAFRYLDRAVELGLDTLRFYESPALFGPLHGHVRWAPFIAGVRERVAGWRREFRWPLPEA